MIAIMLIMMNMIATKMMMSSIVSISGGGRHWQAREKVSNARQNVRT